MQTVAEPGATLTLAIPALGSGVNVTISLRYGERKSDSDEPTFLIRPPAASQLIGWSRVFQSPEIEAFERTRTGQQAPIRLGLDEMEREYALSIARKSLEAYIRRGLKIGADHFRDLPPRFSLTASAGVAVWCDGVVRGSQIIETSPLVHAIITATCRAARDARFRPITAEELPTVRIEVTLLHPFRMPIGFSSDPQLPFAEKGYVLHAPPAIRAYFLPEVFNSRVFTAFEEFRRSLLRKAHINIKAGDRRGYELVAFEVDDFIESSGSRSAVKLLGPVPSPHHSLSSPTLEYIEMRSQLAADWLLGIQKHDGFVPLYVDPLRSRPAARFDACRAAFTGFALAEFARAVGVTRYRDGADRILSYLTEHVLAVRRTDPLTASYLARLDAALERCAAPDLIPSLHRSDDQYRRMDTLTLLQIAATLKNASPLGQSSVEAFRSCVSIIEDRWGEIRSRHLPVTTAVWAEAVSVLSSVNPALANEIAQCIIEHQLPSGAFSAATRSDFVYSRGTGKVFESLAVDPARYWDTLTKSACWLFAMQYDSESMYFIPSYMRPLAIGGFRHDYFNHECWIDAAGHVLLGTARIIARLRV